MRNPLDSFASNWTFGSASSLLSCLVDKFSTRSFDDPVLVGLGGIAMAGPVCQPLNHFSSSSLIFFLWMEAETGSVFGNSEDSK